MPETSEKSIFLEALDLGSEEAREEFLATACGEDHRLKASVRQLLNAHQTGDHVLDEPVVNRKSTSDEQLEDTLITQNPISEDEGSQVGDYRLMEQIGEGGFGLVFVAEQHRPVKRQVALKILKPGMDTREVVARFEAERQALAMMDHPNIAAVFDAGTTDTGRPYFVMELVRGVAITDYCDQHGLNMKDRLRLFVTVCKAVQHAHQKGIIHRDIKPSNVLVASHDGEPVVKVIDFGVAKAIGQNLTDKTIYTRFTAMIGTPLYMSPEQAEMSGLDVDTRSDIYSLGVLLYELLTGTTPFDRKRLGEATYDELRKIIKDEEPPRPSDRLTIIERDQSTLPTSPRVRAENLYRLVRGDLDWIAMKAMEKDRTRRYESVGRLADDIERYLADAPVEARPPSRVYRLKKLAKRNKVMLMTVSLVMASLILGTTISVWQASKAIHERDDKQTALQEAIKAKNEAAAAKKQIEEFAETLKKANILATSGRAHAESGLLAEAYSDYSEAIDTQPGYFNAWLERAALQVNLGMWKPAATDYAEALKLGVPPDNPANWGIAPLFLYTGDSDNYVSYCRSLLQLEKGKIAKATVSEVRAFAISDQPIVDVGLLADRADDLFTEIKERPRAGGKFGRPDGRGFGEFSGPSSGPGAGGRRGPERDRGRGPERNHSAQGPLAQRPTVQRPTVQGPTVQRPTVQGPPGLGPGPGGRNGARPEFGGPGKEGGGRKRRGGHPIGAVAYVAGLAHFRAARYELAIDRLKESLNSGDWMAREIANPILAMAYHKNGQAQEAQAAFERSQQRMEEWTEQMVAGDTGVTPFPWFDLIEARLLHAEASMLMTGFHPAEDPRLRELEVRAQQELQR